MSYWSEVSVFSYAFDVVSWEQLEEALAQATQATAWVDQAMMWAAHVEERISHSEGILSAMVMRLSMHFRADFVGLRDILADVPAPPTPAPPASTLAPTPSARAPSSDDDDDVDLGDF
ncbi:hypothetical protein COCNU_11G007330 [Cocos nucifera]|uniref:Uncharacterized protein n=1 Tax=Cocos nucifera TaxID=13894 RepID=A0A8K0N8Y7_COCNU|nr:hypothetical protein COCNU_11G007330 [Cocos nucifera]